MKRREFIIKAAAGAAGVAVGGGFLASCGETKKDAAGDAADKHELPGLPYAHGALAPAIDEQTMKIHHGKHHQGYVNKLNAALENQPDFQGKTPEELVRNLNDLPETDDFRLAVRHHAGGHYNHSLFWNILTPEQGAPSAALKARLEKDFGSVEDFKQQFSEAAGSVFGSGWAWLILTDAGKLAVTSTPNQDNPLMPVAEMQGKPVMGIDVWEHAYYLNYQNKRGAYVDAFWNVANWGEVEKNLG